MATTLKLPLQKFAPMSLNDMGNWIAGEMIGEGCYRQVFSFGPDPSRFVLKWEGTDNRFANVTEFHIWNELRDSPLALWLAPVRGISPCGIWLLQDRCDTIGKAELPERVPAFLWDIKRENWGMLKGRPVCFDYSNHALFVRHARGLKLKKAKWR